MAASFNLPTLQGPVHKSHFLGPTHRSSYPFQTLKQSSSPTWKLAAKFNLFELLGGRGLCNGEEGLQQELKKPTPLEPSSPPPTTTTNQEDLAALPPESMPENAFEKELLGLTGGFPGGEKGLQEFLQKNPPPKKSPPETATAAAEHNQSLVRKPKPPELPLLMPGMIAIVKNPNSPYHMYCGIVQRITDGKAGVLFEGGNWDRLITFNLNELERRERGPPMVSPRSVQLEEPVKEKKST